MRTPSSHLLHFAEVVPLENNFDILPKPAILPSENTQSQQYGGDYC